MASKRSRHPGLREAVAEAIRRAASQNPYCSIIPGPITAAIYADAAIATITAYDQKIEPWHGKAKTNS